jgi:hypothetical protein
MDTPPPLPSSVKSGWSTGKVILVAFVLFGALALLAVIGLVALGGLGAEVESRGTRVEQPLVTPQPAPVVPRTVTPQPRPTPTVPAARQLSSFTPADIEARCRLRRLEYEPLGSDSHLLSRAKPGQEDRLDDMGVKVYRIKIRKGYDVVFGISVIEARTNFTQAQVDEIMEILAPVTPVEIHGRFIYCNAFRPDVRALGDEVIPMTPRELYDSL